MNDVGVISPELVLVCPELREQALAQLLRREPRWSIKPTRAAELQDYPVRRPLAAGAVYFLVSLTRQLIVFGFLSAAAIGLLVFVSLVI